MINETSSSLMTTVAMTMRRRRTESGRLASSTTCKNNKLPRVIIVNSNEIRGGDALGGQDYIYSQKSGVTDELYMNSVSADIATGELRVNEFKTMNSVHKEDFTVPERLKQKIGIHLVKNFLIEYQRESLNHGGKRQTVVSPLILGIWGGKGNGKSFNVELACAKLNVLPIVTSAGELEDSTAGEPGKLLRRRYLAAGKLTRETGQPTCLIINDIDAGVGRFKHTSSATVNNQIVQGTLMNIADNPTSVFEETSLVGNRLSVPRVPIIVTGNDFSKLYAPLTRDGRMDKMMWEPSREEICAIMSPIFAQHGLKEHETKKLIVEQFPHQPLDFFSAVRNRAIDSFVLEFVYKNQFDFTNALLLLKSKRKSKNSGISGGGESSISIHERKVSYDEFLLAAKTVQNEQQNVNDIQLSREYLANWSIITGDNNKEEKKDKVHRLPLDMVIKEEEAKTKALFEAAKQKMLAAKSTRESIIQVVKFIDIVDDEEEKEARKKALPWEEININRAFQIMYEKALGGGEKVVTIDARPAKDFNRETCKGALSFPAAIRKGGLSEFVDEADVENCVDKIRSKIPDTNTHMIILLDNTGLEYERLILEALSKYYANVKRIQGDLPEYLKHFTPKGTRRPRYVGYGQDNEETMFTASN